MHIEAKVSDLLAGAIGVKPLITRKNTIPILGNVKLVAKGDQLKITGTDLDLMATVTVPAVVKTPGETTLPGSTLYEYLQKVEKDDKVTLRQTEAGDLTIAVRRSRVTIRTLPVSDFPDLDSGNTTHIFDLPTASLLKLFGKAQFAISTEETRYYLNGVYFHVADKKLRCVATDGHRLARIDIDPPAGCEEMPGVIVPRKTIETILGWLGAAETARIHLSATKICIEIGPRKLVSKLIDGTFPEYGRVIPAGNNSIALLDCEQFIACADRVQTMSSAGRAAKLSFGGPILKLTVTNPDAGSAEDELESDYNGAPLDIGFNSSYLTDILAELSSGKCRMAMADPGSPTVFTDPDDSSVLFVLMPMRV